jgi:cyclomaltodextrinase
MRRLLVLLVLLAVSTVIVIPLPAADAETLPRPLEKVEHPEWSYNVAIYEVNVRQFSPGGTFREFETHLPRLKDMGMGILWFMPIHPIGEKNRKGSLGSYYSVRDYYGVNPEFGTMDEFRALVAEIHEMGMYVIIDWVANHSAWDNVLVEQHPDWYMHDSVGNLMPPVADWWDVVGFNYRNRDLRRYMIDAMKFWVEDVGIDGFRCDVAGMVPLDFWEAARAELEAVKPVFMLAEWDSPVAHRAAFDMTYDWDFMGTINRIGKKEDTADALDAYLAREEQAFKRDDFRMLFTSNHDENSWNGTVFERLGGGVEAFAVLSATLPGMPLIYSGQEAGLSIRLDFFEKDQIPWGNYRFQPLYSKLVHLKTRNHALWNGEAGGRVERVYTSEDKSAFAFVRRKRDDCVFAVFNLSDFPTSVRLHGDAYAGRYRDVMTGAEVAYSGDDEIQLDGWGYRLYEGVQPEGMGDLSDLRTYMIGSFTSLAQAETDSDYLDTRLEVAPIWTGRKDGPWLYIEQAVAGRIQRPYRQRVYHLVEEDDGSIRSEVYSLDDPLRFAGDWKKDEPLESLSPDSLRAQQGCTVILRRTSSDVFEGGTVDRECKSDLRGAAYATSEVTITRDGMSTWDRGFDADGNLVWGASHGPYVFKRLH